MRTSSLSALALAACLAACASASPQDPQSTSTASATTAAAAPDLTGRYAFALDESDVVAPLRSKCASQSGGDAAKADACVAEVRAEAAKEGIAFEKDAQGRVVWVSYGEENGVAAVYHQVPVALTSDGAKNVTARTLAPATGLQATSRPIPEGTTLRIEVVDAKTIAMTDSQKGRLVFHRAPAK